MSPNETAFSPHFCQGNLPVGFVFSVPGTEEFLAGKPVAGPTGTNLDEALRHLHSAQPELFRSLDRYAYRITNAISTPMAIALGDRVSEASDADIREPENVSRVLKEVEGISVVILGGRKAGILADDIKALGKGVTVVEVPHVGNQGLNGQYKDAPRFSRLASARARARARRKHRARRWAEEVLRKLSNPNRQTTVRGFELSDLLEHLTRWARGRRDIRGMALVGSYARGASSSSSDIDLVVLTQTPNIYVQRDEWVQEVGGVKLTRTRNWGEITERRVRLASGPEIEFGFGRPSWASVRPADPGTRRVIGDGMRILYDPDGLLARAAKASTKPKAPQ